MSYIGSNTNGLLGVCDTDIYRRCDLHLTSTPSTDLYINNDKQGLGGDVIFNVNSPCSNVIYQWGDLILAAGNVVISRNGVKQLIINGNTISTPSGAVSIQLTDNGIVLNGNVSVNGDLNVSGTINGGNANIQHTMQANTINASTTNSTTVNSTTVNVSSSVSLSYEGGILYTNSIVAGLTLAIEGSIDVVGVVTSTILPDLEAVIIPA